MILDRQRLSNVLSILGTSIGNKVMEVADYVKIDCSDDKVIMSTTDFHAYLSIDFGDVSLANIEPCSILINWKMLNDIVKNSTTETVEFINDNDSHVKIKTNGTYKLSKWSELSDFPSADFTHEAVARWPVPSLLSAWNKAKVAVSRDVTKINYQGVNFDGAFASTDNRRVAVVDFDDEYSSDGMLLPQVFGDVVKHCKNEITIGHNAAGNLLIVTCNEIGLVAGVRLIDATFVDYKRLVDSRKYEYSITLDRTDLFGTLLRLSAFVDKIFKVITITVNYTNNSCDVIIGIENNSGGTETIKSKMIEFSEGFDLDQLNDSVDSAGDDGVKLLEYKYQIENFQEGLACIDSQEDVVLHFQNDGKLWLEEGEFLYLLTHIV